MANGMIAYQALLLAALAAGAAAWSILLWRRAAREQSKQTRRATLDYAILCTGLALGLGALIPVVLTRALWAAVLGLGMVLGSIGIVYGRRILYASRSTAGKKQRP